MDLLGRKLVMSDDRALALLKSRMAATAAAARDITALASYADRLDQAVASVENTLAALSDTAGEKFDNATSFLRAFGHLVAAWMLLDQAVLAHRKGDVDDSYYAGKIWGCRYFFESELPQMDVWLNMVSTRNDLAASAPDGIFAVP